MYTHLSHAIITQRKKYDFDHLENTVCRLFKFEKNILRITDELAIVQGPMSCALVLFS